jgi:methylmalonyl-CoA mutase cobalamin-binding domain/chain
MILHRKKDGIEDALDAAGVRDEPIRVLNEVLLPAMKEVGDKFGAGELILPFVLQSAEAMKKAVRHLEQFLERSEGYTKGRVVLATVYGDVHDIGKSLVNTILSNNGYTVFDLGKQVPVNTIIDKAIEVNADAIGLSALLVSTSKQMPICVQELDKRGVSVPVLIGGAAINRRFGRRAQTTEGAKEVVEKAADAIVVRRARPSDVPSILLLIQRATGGAVKMKRGELLMALGDRGYLIGQQGTEISTVIGWNSENLVARIDQIFVHPPEAARIAGPAVLKEIEDTAISLICEDILAFPTNQVEPAVLQLFLDNSFEEVDPLRLPEAWKAAVDESQPENTFVMMKVLRDTRSMQPG